MYREIIQDSIDYIEDNIKCDISAVELSERAGFSVFHYYRMFQSAVFLLVGPSQDHYHLMQGNPLSRALR